MDVEQKKNAETQKGIRKYERRIKELTYQVSLHELLGHIAINSTAELQARG